MTPRELLKAWLDLSENRALSVKTFDKRQMDLALETITAMNAQVALGVGADLLNRWIDLQMMHFDPEKYWTERKQLERMTREYLETSE